MLPAQIPFLSFKSRIKNNPIKAYFSYFVCSFLGVPSCTQTEVATLKQGAQFTSLCRASLLFGRDGDSEGDLELYNWRQKTATLPQESPTQ